jgi:ABC-type branched-subunit amino acid transport system permease subunit
MNSYYIINLLIYAAVDAMACLGLSQQFGVAGVTNFGFIIFQAAGGYTAAILALPADSANGGFQSYLGGLNLPFPVPWIGAAVVGGLIALPFTFLVGRRLRGDFAAVGLLVTAVLLNLLVTNYRHRGSTTRSRPATSGRSRRSRSSCARSSTCSSAGSPSRPTAAACAPCGTTTPSPTPSARTCSRSVRRCW